MLSVVFDTNVLLDSANDPFHASEQLLQAVYEGDLRALVTPAVIQEYRYMVQRRMPQHMSMVEKLVSAAHSVTPQRTDITIDDLSDKKFLEAAIGGKADLLVTSDHHLLSLGTIGTTRIVRPQEAWIAFEDAEKGSKGWMDFITGIGVRR